MSINFDLFNSRNEVDDALDGYSDEELAYTYLELQSEYTLMDLTEKIVAYNRIVNDYPNERKKDIYHYF